MRNARFFGGARGAAKIVVSIWTYLANVIQAVVSLCPDVDIPKAINDLNSSVDAVTPFTDGLCTVEYYPALYLLTVESSASSNRYNISHPALRHSKTSSTSVFPQTTYSSFFLPQSKSLKLHSTCSDPFSHKEHQRSFPWSQISWLIITRKLAQK